MRRRDFLAGGVCVGVGGTVSEAAGAADRFVLSAHGCGRATGYAEAVKVVTWGGKTHVGWLDSVDGKFWARVRALDVGSGEWGETVTLGEGFDNHGGPAIAVDGGGFLHAVWGPHHGPFLYRRSVRANDASAWGEVEAFGEDLTYPTMVSGRDGGLIVTGRRSYKDRPWEMEMWKRPTGGKWGRVGTILKARWSGYSHFQESLAWGPGREVLHLCCRAHEKSTGGAYGRVQTVVYLRSEDQGGSWKTTRGEAVDTPADVGMLGGAVIATGGVDAGRDLRVGGMAVDAVGKPLLVWSEIDGDRCESYLSRPDGDGGWTRKRLRGLLPERKSDWQVTVPGGVTVTAEGTVLVVVQLMATAGPVQNWWGHPSSEVGVFRFGREGEFEGFEMMSEVDAEVPHWLPNVERAAGDNVVGKRPGVIWTEGGKGANNKEIVANRVVWGRL